MVTVQIRLHGGDFMDDRNLRWKFAWKLRLYPPLNLQDQDQLAKKVGVELVEWLDGVGYGWLFPMNSVDVWCPPSRYCFNSSKWQVGCDLPRSFDISRGISCATYFFARCFTRVLKLENTCGSQISKHEVCPATVWDSSKSGFSLL